MPKEKFEDKERNERSLSLRRSFQSLQFLVVASEVTVAMQFYKHFSICFYNFKGEGALLWELPWSEKLFWELLEGMELCSPWKAFPPHFCTCLFFNHSLRQQMALLRFRSLTFICKQLNSVWGLEENAHWFHCCPRQMPLKTGSHKKKKKASSRIFFLINYHLNAGAEIHGCRLSFRVWKPQEEYFSLIRKLKDFMLQSICIMNVSGSCED